MATLPPVGTYNANFMANNPQFGSTSNPYGSAPGLTAKNPAANIKQPVNTLSKGQANTAAVGNGAGVGSGTAGGGTSNANTGYVGNPQAFASYTGLTDIGNNGSQQVQAAQDELKRYQQAYANANAGVGMGGTDFNYAQGTEQNIANQYNQGLLARQGALSSAQTQQSTQAGALSSAGSLASGVNQFGVLTAPFTGNPVMGGSPESAAFRGGQIGASQQLGGQSQQQGTAITSARTQAGQLKNLLSSSGLNQNQLALSNWVGNVVANNLSNPKLAPIQSALNSTIAQYASALGITPDQLVNNLTAQSSSQSILSLIDGLDAQAYGNYSATRNIGTGGGVSQTAPQTSTPASNGVTSGGNSYTISH